MPKHIRPDHVMPDHVMLPNLLSLNPHGSRQTLQAPLQPQGAGSAQVLLIQVLKSADKLPASCSAGVQLALEFVDSPNWFCSCPGI